MQDDKLIADKPSAIFLAVCPAQRIYKLQFGGQVGGYWDWICGATRLGGVFRRSDDPPLKQRLSLKIAHGHNRPVALNERPQMIKIIVAAALTVALCACTSQQYAQFNQRVNDSISRTLGTRTEPPPPADWKSETATDYVAAPVPSLQEQADAAYANHIASMGTMPKVTFTPAPEPKQPIAKGMDLVDGAVVCRSYDLAAWMYGQINVARHARQSLSPELRRQAALIKGYDEGAEPRLADWGCVLVPTGTPVALETGNYVPVVSGVLPNGRRFQGVTLPTMIER